MWEQKDYEHHGEAFSVPTPHNILPKPYGEGHPPMWVACGNPATYAKAGAMGLGAIAFNFEPIHNLKGRVDAYLEAAENVTDPVGQFQNHNVMMTNAVICLEDREEARAMAKRNLRGYRVTMVNLYHDSMPQSPDAIVWPNARAHAELDDATLDWAIAEGYMLCGNPEEVCEQLQAYQEVGCTQVVRHPRRRLRARAGAGDDRGLRPAGDPRVRTDPEHSTTKYRRQAQRRFPTFNNPVDPIVDQATPRVRDLDLTLSPASRTRRRAPGRRRAAPRHQEVLVVLREPTLQVGVDLVLVVVQREEAGDAESLGRLWLGRHRQRPTPHRSGLHPWFRGSSRCGYPAPRSARRVRCRRPMTSGSGHRTQPLPRHRPSGTCSRATARRTPAPPPDRAPPSPHD